MSNEKGKMSLTDFAVFYWICILFSINFCVCDDFSSKEKSDYRFEANPLKENEKPGFAYENRNDENFPSAVMQGYKKFQGELGKNWFSKGEMNLENQNINELLMPETKNSYESGEEKSFENIDFEKIMADLESGTEKALKSMPYLSEKPAIEMNKNKRMLKERWIPFSSHKGSKNKSSKLKPTNQAKTLCIDCRQKAGNEVVLDEQSKTEPDFNAKANPKSETQGPYNYFKVNKRSAYPCQCPSCRKKLSVDTRDDLGSLLKETDPSKLLGTTTQKTTLNFDIDYVPNMYRDGKYMKIRQPGAFDELEQKSPEELNEALFNHENAANHERRLAQRKGSSKRYRRVSLSDAELSVANANEERLKILDDIQKKIDNVEIPQLSTEATATEITIGK